MSQPSSQQQTQTTCIAVFGTGSDVGKSIIVTALCRYFTAQGFRVAPFKAQNMSNNSGVTPEGLEMGRAQIVQAEAANIPPHVDMNPILLKPASETGAQVVLLGKAVANYSAKEYHHHKKTFLKEALAALDRLRATHDIVIIEGAGSCAEVNLMPHDIVNFKIAEYAKAQVILVADIHRGGVFGQIVGTLQCLPVAYQNLISGCIINRFRGDISLFQDGVSWLETKTGKKVLGVLPWFHDFAIDAEDSVVIENPAPRQQRPNTPEIAVIRLPHISNFTDFYVFESLDGLLLSFIAKPVSLSQFRAVILPGSKNTNFDLKWLMAHGWDERLKTYAAQGGHILGICGGYQIMGHSVSDPDGLEGPPGTTLEGLKLLPVKTILKAPKTTTFTRFSWEDASGTGYEIHMGQTLRFDGLPLIAIHQRNQDELNDADGCAIENHRLMGTYVHGFFDSPAILKKWLTRLGLQEITIRDPQGLTSRDQAYDSLANHFSRYIDMDGLNRMLIPSSHLAHPPGRRS